MTVSSSQSSCWSAVPALRPRVLGVDADGREFVADAARHGLRVGRGRGQGYGRVAIESILPDPGSGPLRQRLERFDGWVRSRLHSLRDLVDEPDGTYFSVSLASDLVPPKAATGSAEEAFLAALDLPGCGVVVHAEVRAGQRGGWNSLHGGPKALRAVVQAGSVLLVRTDLALEELLPAMRQLESRGAGRATEEGFGTVRVSDPIHDPDGGSHDT